VGKSSSDWKKGKSANFKLEASAQTLNKAIHMQKEGNYLKRKGEKEKRGGF